MTAVSDQRFDEVLGARRGRPPADELHHPSPTAAAHDRLARLCRQVSEHAGTAHAHWRPDRHPLADVAAALHAAGPDLMERPLSAQLAAHTAHELAAARARAYAPHTDRFAYIIHITDTPGQPAPVAPAAAEQVAAQLLTRMPAAAQAGPAPLLSAFTSVLTSSTYRDTVHRLAAAWAREHHHAIIAAALATRYASLDRAVSELTGRPIAGQVLLTTAAWGKLHSLWHLTVAPDLATYSSERVHAHRAEFAGQLHDRLLSGAQARARNRA